MQLNVHALIRNPANCIRDTKTGTQVVHTLPESAVPPVSVSRLYKVQVITMHLIETHLCVDTVTATNPFPQASLYIFYWNTDVYTIRYQAHFTLSVSPTNLATVTHTVSLSMFRFVALALH